MLEPIRTGKIDCDLFAVTHAQPTTQNAVRKVFQQMGSPRAFVAEFIFAEEWAASYTRINQSKGYDLHPLLPGLRRIEVKMSSSSNGAVDFKPSGGKGKGRTPEVGRFYDNCEANDYLVVDGVYFAKTGNIRYAVFSGLDLKAQRIDKLTGKVMAVLFAGVV